MASSTVAMAAGIPQPWIDGKQCGEVTIKIGDREFKSALYPEIYSDGGAIIKINITGNPMITHYSGNAALNDDSDDIQKAAIAACSK